MLNTFLQLKTETVLIFIGSFSFGTFLAKNAEPLGTLIGALASTVLIKILDWGFKKVRNHYKNKQKN